MFYRKAEHFTLEALCLHGPKVASFQLAPRGKRWYVVSCYIAPDNASTIEAVVAATSQKPCGADLLVIGNFNADLESPEENACDEESASALPTTVLEDMSSHFFPRAFSSGDSKLALKLPITSRSAPQGFWLVAATTASMVEALSGVI